MLFTGVSESMTGVATREIVATEIVRALVGSIGLVASVPISTWLAIAVIGPTNVADEIPAVRWGDDLTPPVSPGDQLGSW